MTQLNNQGIWRTLGKAGALQGRRQLCTKMLTRIIFNYTYTNYTPKSLGEQIVIISGIMVVFRSSSYGASIDPASKSFGSSMWMNSWCPFLTYLPQESDTRCCNKHRQGQEDVSSSSRPCLIFALGREALDRSMLADTNMLGFHMVKERGDCQESITTTGPAALREAGNKLWNREQALCRRVCRSGVSAPNLQKFQTIESSCLLLTLVNLKAHGL